MKCNFRVRHPITNQPLSSADTTVCWSLFIEWEQAVGEEEDSEGGHWDVVIICHLFASNIGPRLVSETHWLLLAFECYF